MPPPPGRGIHEGQEPEGGWYAQGKVAGVAVRVGCSCTWDGADDEPWDAVGRPCVGEAWAWVRVGGSRIGEYGYGTVGMNGDVSWVGAGADEIGDPRDLMGALGHSHPDERIRKLHGAALRGATARWDRLVERMTVELVDLLPGAVDVPEPEPDGHEDDENEEAYA